MMSTTLTKTWTRANDLAAATPPGRNRYVDFLRAVSIAVVVLGHWLIAAPLIANGDVRAISLLSAEPWTQWLTWVFQVMPIFFVVGGYSNAASWTASVRRGETYSEWLSSRLRRLVMPAVPLVIAWSGFALGARALGIDGALLGLSSQVALIPLWFLATYVVAVALTPLTQRLWNRFGLGSIIAMFAAAAAVDALRFSTGDLVGWANFVFVWGAMHQLGYAWRDRRLGTTSQALAVGIAGFVGLVGLVAAGPYAVAMVGVAGANNSPPTLALATLGLMQTGFLIAAAPTIERWLAQRRPWAATIVVNSSIMTLYLWHLTAMVVVIGASLVAGGAGLDIEPTTGHWWATRPLWMFVLAAATVPFLGWFGRYERPTTAEPLRPWRTLAVVALACVGFANIAGGGVANADVWIRPEAVIPILVAGALLSRSPQAPRAG